MAHPKGVRQHLKTLDSDAGELVSEGHDVMDVKDVRRVGTECYKLIAMARDG